MAIFAVHAPEGAANPELAIDRAVAIRQGFARWGFVFGPLWLLAHRLWRPFIAWAIGAGAAEFALSHGVLSPAATGLLLLLGDLYIGLEGRAMQAAALARRKLPLADVVVGADSVAAAHGFAVHALQTRSAPAAPREPRYRASPSDDEAIIGLFPEAGG